MGNVRHVALEATRPTASISSYLPTGTVKCDGRRKYRSQAARDAACLLDLDPSVVSWKCMPADYALGENGHRPDFVVFNDDDTVVCLDAPDRNVGAILDTLAMAAPEHGARYRLLSHADVYDGFRLRNAKDLLRYASAVTPLGDRIRLLAALDEHGSLPMAECLKAFQETRPVPGIASLILHGYLEVDLDDAPLGPETAVRRIGR